MKIPLFLILFSIFSPSAFSGETGYGGDAIGDSKGRFYLISSQVAELLDGSGSDIQKVAVQSDDGQIYINKKFLYCYGAQVERGMKISALMGLDLNSGEAVEVLRQVQLRIESDKEQCSDLE